MKNKLLYISMIFVLALESCTKGFESDGLPPVITAEETIDVSCGLDAVLNGTATASEGLKSIIIASDGLEVYKEYLFDSYSPREYGFSYNFVVPASLDINQEQQLRIVATDVSGKATTKIVRANYVADNKKPEFLNFNVPSDTIMYIPGENIKCTYTLVIDVKDNIKIATVNYKCDAIGANKTIEVNEVETRLNYNVEFTQSGVYTYDITLTDSSGNSNTKSITFNVISTPSDISDEIFTISVPTNVTVGKYSFITGIQVDVPDGLDWGGYQLLDSYGAAVYQNWFDCDGIFDIIGSSFDISNSGEYTFKVYFYTILGQSYEKTYTVNVSNVN